MATEKRLIDGDKLRGLKYEKVKFSDYREGWNDAIDTILTEVFSPSADAVEVETIKAWLYEIAMNNTSNYLCDACEDIIGRLDGLRAFARERRTDNA